MNKYSKQRVDKVKMSYNKKMEFKKKIRLLYSKLIPLSENEKWKYEKSEKFRNKSRKIDDGMFISINDIYLINAIKKTKCEELYNGILKLHTENPLKKYLDGEVEPNSLRSLINSFSNSTNSERWGRLLAMTPKDSNLTEISGYVEIGIFEISSDYIGISFHLNISDEYKKIFKSILNRDYEEKIEYVKYCDKNVFGMAHIEDSTQRNNDIEDYILEIKTRFNDLFSKYLPLDLKYEKKAPISLNIYQTNYNLIEEKSEFLLYLNIIGLYSKEKIENVSMCVSEEKGGDTFETFDIIYNTSYNLDEIDRSKNIFVQVKKEKIIKTSFYEYINFFLVALSIYQLEEMNDEISNQRNILYNSSHRKITTNYEHYINLYNEFQKYRNLFNNIKVYRTKYKRFEKYFSVIKEKYDKSYEQYERLTKEYAFRMETNNSISAYRFGVISILIALLAIFLTIYFEYFNIKKENYVNIEINNYNSEQFK